MSCNVGGMERAVRFAAGGALLSGGLLGSKEAPGRKTAAIIGGVLLLATAATQYCPLNTARGVNTCPVEERDENAPDLIRLSTPTVERVTANSDAEVNQLIEEETLKRVRMCAAGGPLAIQRRLDELEREWDFERVMEAEGGTTILAGLALGALVNRKFYFLPVFAGLMGILHAMQGAYPLLPLFRALKLRTPEEIRRERLALKVLRGDFNGVEPGSDPNTSIIPPSLP
jgi:hypothetical protein